LCQDVLFLSQVLGGHVRRIRVDHKHGVLILFLETELVADLPAPVLFLHFIRESIEVQDSNGLVAVLTFRLYDEQIVKTSEFELD